MTERRWSPVWIAHICFSPCGETKRIADHFYAKCGGVFYDFTDPAVRDGFDVNVDYQLIVLSLPVYAESVPDVMKDWLKRLRAERYVLNLAYGGKRYGDAAAIAAGLVGNDKVIAWSVTVVKHCYCEGPVDIDFSLYDPVIAKVNGTDMTPCPVPHVKANPLAHFFPKKRARINVSVAIDRAKCIHCGACVKRCPVRAITPEPAVTKDCIRCGLCPKLCPVGAIRWTMTPLLAKYLKNRKSAGAVIRTR